jgi:hypothetical protein
MATLSELKARIILELDRDDLGAGGGAESALTNAIARAIEHHSDEAFWFNRTSGTSETSVGTASAAMPASVRIAQSVWLAGEPLSKLPLDEIAARSEQGRPRCWAEADGLVQLWPIPDAAYSLTVAGIAQIGPPAGEGEQNAWLEESYDLIAARVRMLLCRDVFRDTEGAQLAAQAEAEALDRLRRETRRRGVIPLRSPADGPWAGQASFNVNMG